MAVIWMGTGRFGVAYDANAQAYITAVEAADAAAGQSGGLESGVKDAINAFVVDCKADGIWNAIKASCILAGARTLQGCLVPLVGAAPTNVNFVAGDYNRKTGLVGNGSTKYLNANFLQNSVGRNNHHVSAWMSSQIAGFVIGSAPANASSPGDGLAPGAVSNSYRFRSRYDGVSAETDFGNATILGFIGASRSAAASFTARTASTNTTITTSSVGPGANATHIFRRPTTSSPIYSQSRLAFYSIGESLNLALLDARVTTLINAIAAAIP
jgi:hypothetical protein